MREIHEMFEKLGKKAFIIISLISISFLLIVVSFFLPIYNNISWLPYSILDFIRIPDLFSPIVLSFLILVICYFLINLIRLLVIKNKKISKVMFIVSHLVFTSTIIIALLLPLYSYSSLDQQLTTIGSGIFVYIFSVLINFAAFNYLFYELRTFIIASRTINKIKKSAEDIEDKVYDIKDKVIDTISSKVEDKINSFLNKNNNSNNNDNNNNQ